MQTKINNRNVRSVLQCLDWEMEDGLLWKSVSHHMFLVLSSQMCLWQMIRNESGDHLTLQALILTLLFNGDTKPASFQFNSLHLHRLLQIFMSFNVIFEYFFEYYVNVCSNTVCDWPDLNDLICQLILITLLLKKKNVSVDWLLNLLYTRHHM